MMEALLFTGCFLGDAGGLGVEDFCFLVREDKSEAVLRACFGLVASVVFSSLGLSDFGRVMPPREKDRFFMAQNQTIS